MGLRFEILSTGDEVLTGTVVDTNAAFLAEAASDLGFAVAQHTTVGDDRDSLRQALTDLGARADIVLCTGGLGPTVDDLTTDVVASILAVPRTIDPFALEKIERRWKSLGQPMPENNRKQASIPATAEVLANTAGMAPGYTLRIGRATFFFLPGVPGEMKEMFRAEVSPRLSRLRPVSDNFEVRVFRAFGVPESVADAKLSGLEARFQGVKLGFRAHFPELHVKLTVKGAEAAQAKGLLAEASAEVMETLGPAIFSQGASMEQVVADALAKTEATVTTAEAFSGGLLAQMLTPATHDSNRYERGLIASSQAVIAEDLGVGTDLFAGEAFESEVSAQAVAEAARRRAGTTYGLATLGAPRPADTTSERWAGTVLAVVAGPRETHARTLFPPGSWAQARAMAAMAAMDLLRRALLGLPFESLPLGTAFKSSRSVG
jgi:nicotinamide-nucleotide amidase